MTAREAKEFLIEQIIEEANRQNMPLDDIERRMLFFTETGWMPEGMWEASKLFDQRYNQPEYEAKIAALIRGFPTTPQWNRAINTLREEDHYLLVMIAETPETFNSWRPPYDFLKLISTAILVIAIFLGGIFAYHAIAGW